MSQSAVDFLMFIFCVHKFVGWHVIFMNMWKTFLTAMMKWGKHSLPCSPLHIFMALFSFSYENYEYSMNIDVPFYLYICKYIWMNISIYIYILYVSCWAYSMLLRNDGLTLAHSLKDRPLWQENHGGRSVGDWSHFICSQEPESIKCQCPPRSPIFHFRTTVNGLVLSTLRVELLTSLKPI